MATDPTKPIIDTGHDVSDLLGTGVAGLPAQPIKMPKIADLVADFGAGDVVDVSALLAVGEPEAGFYDAAALSLTTNSVLSAHMLAVAGITFGVMPALTVVFDDGLDDPSTSSI